MDPNVYIKQYFYPFYIFIIPADSNGCVYKVHVPLQQIDSEELHILPKSLLTRLEESGTIFKHASIAILDKDHIAVTGCLDSPDRNIKGKASCFRA